MSHSLLADIVLTLHAAVVLFIVGGLVLIFAGNQAGWRWVNGWWFRLAHLAGIGIVVGQAWLGLDCPLTTLEVWLRGPGETGSHADGFIAYWLGRLLYYRLPAWIFVLAYSVFGALVTLAWWRYPPVRRDAGGG
ncbi:DUF2784 domain-containing protein [Noviherbaspirillum soli]|uniref:DUF2784 domain-containing protein n=1 Tax=Noviherbaspirillum soli TaxID=1064518 RepID=UPI00188CDD44|nr:DUF2784 domain-containing protein [Noviherbaspirillum soli]